MVFIWLIYRQWSSSEESQSKKKLISFKDKQQKHPSTVLWNYTLTSRNEKQKFPFDFGFYLQIIWGITCFSGYVFFFPHKQCLLFCSFFFQSSLSYNYYCFVWIVCSYLTHWLSHTKVNKTIIDILSLPSYTQPITHTSGVIWEQKCSIVIKLANLISSQ